MMACLSLSQALGANTVATGYVITIENVELMNSTGAWVSVIRPDKRVDLLSTEAAISFFNNTGRVPAGSYENFRIEFFRPDGQKVRLGAVNKIANPLQVKKGSFIRVWFDLEVTGEQASVLQAKKASVTVDGHTEEMEKLQWF